MSIRVITNVQFATKNEKFIKVVKDLPNSKQTHITYWCKPKDISCKNEPNEELIETKIDITDMTDNGKRLATGVVEDVIIDTVENLYNSQVYGRNRTLGLPQSYNLADFIYEINNTLEGNYGKDDLIGGCYIRINALPINQKQKVKGNMTGRKTNL